MRGQRERIDATMRLPFRQAPSKIGFQAGGSLVALLGVFGEELHGDSRQRLGDRGALAGRCRLARDVAVDPLQGIGGSERQSARQHLVEGDAEGVEIAARIDRAVHAAGLLGRHVGEGAGNDLGRRGRLELVRQLGRDPESGKPDVAGLVDQHVRRLDILMDQAVPMDLVDCRRQANGDAHAAGQLERLPLAPIKDPVHGLAARIVEYEDRPPFVTRERQRPGRPRGIKFRCERVFVLKPPEARRRRMFSDRRQHQDRERVVALPAAIKDELPPFPQRLEHISGKFRHGKRRPTNGSSPPAYALWQEADRSG